MNNLSKEEAEKMAEGLNLASHDPDKQKFCPLINYGCYSNCVCFQPAKVGKHRGSDAWYVIEPGCTNAMFFNQCQCQ